MNTFITLFAEIFFKAAAVVYIVVFIAVIILFFAPKFIAWYKRKKKSCQPCRQKRCYLLGHRYNVFVDGEKIILFCPRCGDQKEDNVKGQLSHQRRHHYFVFLSLLLNAALPWRIILGTYLFCKYHELFISNDYPKSISLSRERN